MNPTGQPMGMPAPSAPSGSAQTALNVPSILILVMAGLGILFGLVGLVSGGGTIPPQLLDNPQLTPQIREMLMKFSGAGRFGNVIGIALDGLMIYGALQMRQLKSFGLAMTSAILVMLPCAGCCCLLGLPVGIWALVTLNKPEVKSAFS
jgi:hypothetical protein